MKRVYFIKPIGMQGPIKIGCSHSPDKRRESLETWSPFPLEIMAEIPGGTILERRFHAYFRPTHQRREWFNWSPEIERTIALIRAGKFDISVLPEPQCVSHLHVKRKPWSEESKRAASYTHRLRIVRSKHDLVPRKVSCGQILRFIHEGDEASLALVDEFLADPFAHGCTFAEKYPELIAEWERRQAAWAARKLAA